MSARPRGGLRKRRTDIFVQVSSKTVNDGAMSYRALGVLTYLLDKPDGWEVKAEHLMKGPNREDREGREAVRTALRELGARGYYRLERRRFRDGTFEMGTAISETPVASWAEQCKFFDGKAIPVVEQPDGSFLVRYPDGTLQPDDFPPPIDLTGAQEPVPGYEDHTGDGFPGPGKPASGEPDTGLAASGELAPGNTSPITEGLPQRGYTDTDGPTDHPRSTGLSPVQPALDGTAPTSVDEGPTADQRAFGIARDWMAHRASKDTPVVMSGKGNALHALQKLIVPFATSGYTDIEIKKAMDRLNVSIPSTSQLDRALAEVRAGKVTDIATRRGRPDPADLRVNSHWETAAPTAAGGA